MDSEGWDNRHTRPQPALWEKLKPIAREMRINPTPAELRLWSRLRDRQCAGLRFRRQHVIDRFIVDFYCGEHNLVIEVDGEIHQYTKEEDAIRQEFLGSLNLKVIRFSNEQVMKSIDDVLQVIKTYVV
ncbi:MAG: endonuclease domain-containing protein [Anaerolineae bacterium]|nr:endonuclease domain-containing protein [Anaerolineae bacterium]